jgi:transcriptional regulator with XRE-family HTH domain
MMAIDEKSAFSMRLCRALGKVGVSMVSPTLVAREFNKRYNGKSVTTQAVRKWLAGEAIPSQDKLRVLAEWLKVSVQWLRFGDGSEAHLSAGLADGMALGGGSPASWEGNLAEAFARLNSRHREMVMEMVAALLRLEEKNGQ